MTTAVRKKTLRRRVLLIAAFALSVGLVAWLISRVDIRDIGALVADADPKWLLLAGACVVALPPLMAWRWKSILWVQGAGSLPFWGLVRAVMTANLLNSFLPGKAGDLVKAVYVRRLSGLSRSVGGVVLERTVDVAVLGLLGLASYVATGNVWGLKTALLLVSLSVGAVVVVRWLPVERWVPGRKLPNIVINFRHVWKVWSAHPRLMAQTFFASAVVWMLCGSVLGCLGKALDLPLSFWQAWAVFPLAVMAGMVPVTVGGLGTRETVMTLLLTPLLTVTLPAGTAQLGATALSLGYTVFTYWLLSLLSVPVAWGEMARVRRFLADESATHLESADEPQRM